MARRIAIVEDEPAIRANYLEALRRQGYEVSGFGGRGEAMRAFRERLPDLVVIDIGLGEEAEGGFDLCRELRALSPTVPILFLTARDSEIDTVSGLRLGADDYLSKSISLTQLLARIAALFRRVEALSGATGEGRRLERGPLVLDEDRLEASWRGVPLGLTVTEFWLVHALARRPGHVRSRDQLMDAAHLQVSEATITSHVKRIRRKLEAVDPTFEAIESVYGTGYRWR